MLKWHVGTTGVKPRVAVAGAGAFGKNHLRVIHQSEHAELAGVYDLDPARAAAVAEPHGCRVFQSLNELAGNADAAVIARASTPMATRTSAHTSAASTAVSTAS